MDFYSAASLKQQSLVDIAVPFGHIILIPREQVCALLLNAAYSKMTNSKPLPKEPGIKMQLHFEWIIIVISKINSVPMKVYLGYFLG